MLHLERPLAPRAPVAWRAVTTAIPAILYPFPDGAVHIVQPEPVRHNVPHRHRHQLRTLRAIPKHFRYLPHPGRLIAQAPGLRHVDSFGRALRYSSYASTASSPFARALAP